MKLVLTRKGDGVKITVDSELIRLIEPGGDEGTHIVFDAGQVRTVAETMEEINAALGAIAPHAAIAALMKPKFKKK